MSEVHRQRRATRSLEPTRGSTNSFEAAFEVAKFFVVRTPLLPLTDLSSWTQVGRGGDNDSERPSPRHALVSALLARIAEPVLRCAIKLASPDVDALLESGNASQLQTEKLLRTLTRYFCRAAGRETPFGLFAGVSFGSIGGHDVLELLGSSGYRASTRVAPAYLRDVMLELGSRPDVGERLTWELNSTLGRVHGCYRLLVDESPTGATASRSKSVVEIERTAELERIVAHARAGTTLAQLRELLAERGFPSAEISAFLEQLREQQVLESSWAPAATGGPSLQAAISKLSPHAELAFATALLSEVRHLLVAATFAPIRALTNHHDRARRKLAELPSKSSAQPLQVDLVKPAPRLSLGRETTRSLLFAAALLQRTGAVPVDGELSEFRRNFTQRYGSRLVPLLEVVDRDIGIGFGRTDSYADEPLLEGLKLEAKRAPHRGAFNGSDVFRAKLLAKVLASGTMVCELDERALAPLSRETAVPLPESFAIMARLARGADGELLIVAPMVAPAASILARFCEAEPQLENAMQAFTQREQQLSGDVVLADIAHLPSDQSANVVVRPCLRDFEIPVAGRSSAPPAQQLRLDELYVGVEGDRTYLYAPRIRRRVSVRVTNAHNFNLPTSPAVYRFLGALQHQDSSLVSGWSWGALEDADFLPRVVHGNVVLSVARWRLRLPRATSSNRDEAVRRLTELRTQLKLPRFITRSEHDQTLIIDLDNELCVDELLHEARKTGMVVVEELLPGPDELVVHGPEGGFAAQVVVPFLRREAATQAPPLPLLALDDSATSARVRAPGTDWLYAKVYCPRSRMHDLVRMLRHEVIHAASGNGTADWFYLPYADPEEHLRFRVRGSPRWLHGTILNRLTRTLTPLVARGEVWRWELSTYERELERYGGPERIELAERVFGADSEAAAALLEVCNEPALLWQLVLVGIDHLYRDAGLSVQQRLEVACVAIEGYGRELGVDLVTRRRIGEKHRLFADCLTRQLWGEPADGDDTLRRAREIWRVRSGRLRATWNEYRRLEAAGQLPVPLPELCFSFAHLHAVRLLGVSARTQEFVLYELLKRQYMSRLHRLGDQRVAAAP